MSPSWRRIARVAAVFTVVGWLSAVCIGATEEEVSLVQSLIDGTHLRAALIGALSAVLWGPVWALGRPPIWLGPLLGLIAGLCGIYLYFFAFPHEWQGDRLMAWKSAKVVVGTYYRWLIPLFLAGGGGASWWVRRAVPAARWERADAEAQRAEAALAEQATDAVAPLAPSPIESVTAALPAPVARESPTIPVSGSSEDRLREGATVPLPPGGLAELEARLLEARSPARTDEDTDEDIDEEDATEQLSPMEPGARDSGPG